MMISNNNDHHDDGWNVKVIAKANAIVKAIVRVIAYAYLIVVWMADCRLFLGPSEYIWGMGVGKRRREGRADMEEFEEEDDPAYPWLRDATIEPPTQDPITVRHPLK